MLSVENLHVAYPGANESPVLQKVTFSARQGERLALLGANGAGKSTLLLSIVGVLPIESGEARVNNLCVEPKNFTAIRRAAGLVFQNPDDQLFMSTVYEDILFGPLNYLHNEKKDGASVDERAGIETRARALLEQLGIAHIQDKMPHKLSGGEKRLAALASVLIMEPCVILMDEPSAFLDPRARRRLITILSGRAETLVIATHDLELARELCPRSIVLSKGRVCADGPTAAILADTALLDDCALC